MDGWAARGSIEGRGRQFKENPVGVVAVSPATLTCLGAGVKHTRSWVEPGLGFSR